MIEDEEFEMLLKEEKVRRPMMPLFLDECQNCGALEERVFTDSWTGLELCVGCLSPIVGELTSSPCSEGDNMMILLEARCR